MNAELDDLERRMAAAERELWRLPPEKREETRQRLREMREGIEMLCRSLSAPN
jgi:phage-related protein